MIALGIVLTGCGSKKTATAKAPATNAPAADNSSGNPLTAPVDYLGAINQAHKMAVKTIDKTSVEAAIQRFNAMEERFPRDLNELVTQHYLSRIPELPNGMRYLYTPQNGQLAVVKQQ